MYHSPFEKSIPGKEKRPRAAGSKGAENHWYRFFPPSSAEAPLDSARVFIISYQWRDFKNRCKEEEQRFFICVIDKEQKSVYHENITLL